MNKEDFLKRLERSLKAVPKEERQEALNYYREYLEEGTASELGSPEAVAKQIINQCAVSGLENRSSSPKTFWLVLLAVFAAPVALPVAIAAAAVALVVVIVLLSVVLALIITGTAFVIGGIAAVIVGITIVSADFVNMLMILGAGLFLVGAGILAVIWMIYLGRAIFRLLAALLGKMLRRSGKNE